MRATSIGVGVAAAGLLAGCLPGGGNHPPKAAILSVSASPTVLDCAFDIQLDCTGTTTVTVTNTGTWLTRSRPVIASDLSQEELRCRTRLAPGRSCVVSLVVTAGGLLPFDDLGSVAASDGFVVGVAPLRAGSVEVEVVVNGSKEGSVPLTVESGDTVEAVKHKIQDRTGASPGQQVLTFNGLVLDDAETVSSYGIGAGSVLVLAVDISK